jgi:parallel beta-helix repeat protein
MKKLLTILFSLPLIASANTRYWSQTGSDANAGDIAHPWATVAKINSFLTTANPGDTIMLERGSTFYGTVNITRSGTPASPIVFAAYGTGAKPILTVFNIYSTWTSEGGGIYSAPATGLSNVNIVLLNGVVQKMGRYPNTGWLTFESHVSNTSITDNELPASPSWTGAEAVIRKNRYTIDRQPITNHSTHVLTLSHTTAYGPYANNGAYTPIDGYGYFIQNSLLTLDTLGEWFYGSNKLYMYFGGAGPSGAVIKVGAADKNISVSTQHDVTFSNIRIEGSNIDAAYLITARGFSFYDCSFSNHGGNAVYVGGGNHLVLIRDTIENCLNDAGFINYSGDSAVVKNCLIQNIGLIPGAGKSADNTYEGIRLFGDHHIMEGNTVLNVGYNSLAFNGSYDTVKNNFIQTFCKVKDDGGGIYTYAGFDSTSLFYGRYIFGNIVINQGKNGAGAFTGVNDPFGNYPKDPGIYVDDNSQNIRIDSNTAANCGWTGYYLHNAAAIQMHGNISYNNGQSQFFIEQSGPNDVRTRNLVVIGNQFISRDSSVPTMVYHSYVPVPNGSIGYAGVFDSNYYSRPVQETSTIEINMEGISDNFYTPSSLFGAYGLDQHSRISPVTFTSVGSNFNFLYNYSGATATNYLNQKIYKDVPGILYNANRADIKRFYSTVLLKTGSIGTLKPKIYYDQSDAVAPNSGNSDPWNYFNKYGIEDPANGVMVNDSTHAAPTRLILLVSAADYF